METAVIDTIEQLENKPKTAAALQLRPYCFKPGQSGNPNGRRIGSKNRITAEQILKTREGRIARHYVKRAEKSDSVLIHAMDRLLPAKSQLSAGQHVIVFIGDGIMPRSPDMPLPQALPSDTLTPLQVDPQ